MENYLSRCPLTVSCRQDAFVLHLYFFPYHHEGRLFGACAEFELHLQPTELSLHIFNPRVVVGDAPGSA